MVFEHSYIKPSAFSTTVPCPASLRLQERYPELDDSGAEGRASHWVAQEIFYVRPVAVGDIDPDGTVLDPDMIQHAQSYVDYVRSIGVVGVESKVSLPRIHADCFGTIDAHFILNGWLHIFDYKYGFIPVEAFENWQCLGYSSAFNGVRGITIHIVQPRAHHVLGRVRTWSVDVDVFLRYLSIIRQAVTDALSDNPLCNVGVHCRFCSARINCPAAIGATQIILEISKRAIPIDLTSEQISRELSLLRQCKILLDARVNGIEAQVEANLYRGTRYPQWRLEPGRGSTTWVKPKEEIFKIGDMLGIELRKEAQPITPIQAKNLGLNHSFFKTLTKNTGGKLKLTEIDKNFGRKLFGG